MITNNRNRYRAPVVQISNPFKKSAFSLQHEAVKKKKIFIFFEERGNRTWDFCYSAGDSPSPDTGRLSLPLQRDLS
jgi:hypothetical protein